MIRNYRRPLRDALMKSRARSRARALQFTVKVPRKPAFRCRLATLEPWRLVPSEDVARQVRIGSNIAHVLAHIV